MTLEILKYPPISSSMKPELEASAQAIKSVFPDRSGGTIVNDHTAKRPVSGALSRLAQLQPGPQTSNLQHSTEKIEKSETPQRST